MMGGTVEVELGGRAINFKLQISNFNTNLNEYYVE